jgi:hypothetical protein
METKEQVEPGPLTYTEGEMIRPMDGGPSKKACWLSDADDRVVAAVTEDADFERSKVLLSHAAHATSVVPLLLAACRRYIELDDKWRTGSPIDPRHRAELDIQIRDAVKLAEGR